MPQPLGEFPPARRPFFKGALAVAAPPAVLIGSADCIAAGDTLPLPAGLTRSLVSGIDSRCWSSRGLAVPPSPIWAPLVWLTPASLPVQLDGTLLFAWADASGNRNDVSRITTGGFPTLRKPGLAGLPEAQVDFLNWLAWGPELNLGNAHSVYIVGTLGPTVLGHVIGPGLNDDFTPSRVFYNTYIDGMNYLASHAAATLPYATTAGTPHLWWWRRSPTSVELGAKGLAVQSFTMDARDVSHPKYILASQSAFFPAQQARYSEVLMWSCALDDAAHAGVLAYLAAKYPI